MSDSVKKMVAGVLLALGFALVSAVALPLYVLPLGFVWIIFLVWLHARFGPVPAYVGAVGLGLAAFWALGAPEIGKRRAGQELTRPFVRMET